MKLLKKYINLKILFALIFLCIVISLNVIPVESKTLDDIEQEIEDKEAELEQLENELLEAENAVKYFEDQQATSSTQLEAVENEIKKLESKIKSNEVDLEKHRSELELLELYLSQDEGEFKENIIDYYIYNKRGVVDIFVENERVDGFWKSLKYRETLLDNDYENLNSLARDVEDLKGKKKELENKVESLNKESAELAEQKKELLEQQTYYASMASYNASRQEGIRSEMGAVQMDIEGLTAEQQKMLEQEQQIIKDAAGGTEPLEPGEFYFYGRGRSVYQGHGLGFSQWGAYGAAESGMNAEEIAKFYYPGSYIGNHVDNGVEDKIKYLGEIPDKACGTQKQVNENPAKYELDDPNSVWDCWPEESIKAQVIVARSYAYTGGTQQVYKSYKGKEWAVNETRGRVLKKNDSSYRDNVLKAFFSADNNNGWGTGTHKNPMFCGRFDGECGGGYSWLQGVNDSVFAKKGPYTDWMWRTNSYTLEELGSMFDWYGNGSFSYPLSSDVKNLKNAVGDLKDMDFERDSSGRVARIQVIGTKGTRQMNGDFFKRIFVFWAYNVKPSGEVDPIFSLTYHFRKV